MKVPKQASTHNRPSNAAKALVAKVRESDQVLVRAAEAANGSREARAVEREFGKFETEILEPWDKVPSR